MASTRARICGGHLEIEFVTDPDGTHRIEDGELAVTVSPGRMWWDGEEVSDVVAEASAVAWSEVHLAEDEEDDE